MVKVIFLYLLSIGIVHIASAQYPPQLLHSRLMTDTTEHVYGFKNDVDGRWVFVNTLGEPVEKSDILLAPDKPKRLKDSSLQLVEGIQSESWYKVTNRERRYGYVDMEGNTVIPCKYKEVWLFKDGLAPAMLPGNSHYEYINKEGQTVFTTSYRWAFEFSEGLAKVEKWNKSGFINLKGEEVIKCAWSYAADFSEGRAMVVKGKKHGYIDRNGHLVIACQYKYAYPFNEGLAVVSMDGSNYYFIDSLGNKAFDTLYNKAFSFNEGLAPVRTKRGAGYINHKGEWVIPPQFTDAFLFNGPLALVVLDANRDFVPGHSSMKYISYKIFALIDRSGNTQIVWADPPKEDNIFAADYWGPKELPLSPVVVASVPAGANVYFIPTSIGEMDPGIVNQPNRLKLRLQPKQTNNTYYVYPRPYIVAVEYGAKVVVKAAYMYSDKTDSIRVDFVHEEGKK